MLLLTLEVNIFVKNVMPALPPGIELARKKRRAIICNTAQSTVNGVLWANNAKYNVANNVPK